MKELKASPITRRWFVRVAGIAGAGALAAACAPAAAPAPAPAPAPASAPAQPTAQPSSPAPAAAPAPAPQAPTKPAWEVKWDQWLVEARKEGTVSVVVSPGVAYRKMLDVFEETFPGIKVQEQVFNSSSILIPRVTQERDAGIYSFDAAVFSTRSLTAKLKPLGVFDPIRPIIIRPGVLDDSKWIGGFEAGFVDNEKKYSYLGQAVVGSQFYYNSDEVDPAELKTMKDLLNPKWKGKMIMGDVRTGYTFPVMWKARKLYGDEFITQLLIGQEVVFNRDPRQVAEQMVRGKYQIATGISKTIMQPYVEQGLGTNIKSLSFPDVQVETASGTTWLFNKGPHPYASRIFVNWILTQHGQATLSRLNGDNSRRTDVEVQDPATLPAFGPDYLLALREVVVPEHVAAREFMEDLLK